MKTTLKMTVVFAAVAAVAMGIVGCGGEQKGAENAVGAPAAPTGEATAAPTGEATAAPTAAPAAQ